jgi:origin recognition complex subunit 2
MSLDALLDSAPRQNARSHVHVLVHSLDAPYLRAPAEQAALARLAACANVRFAATVDHVNAAALFDARRREAFQWLWHHVPTFEPLWLETLAAPPALVAAAHVETKQSASVVLAMLTPSARVVCCPS